MTNSKHVHLYWGGPLLFGPPNAYFWGGQDPPTPPGIDAPAGNELVQEQLILNELRSRLSMFTAIQWIIKPSACKFIKK